MQNPHKPRGESNAVTKHYKTVLCQRYWRVVSKDSIIQFRKSFYFVTFSEVNVPGKAKIEIRVLRDKTIYAYYNKKSIPIKPLSEVTMPEKIMPPKVVQKKVYHPSPMHSWSNNKKSRRKM